jgi:hypothetical protein
VAKEHRKQSIPSSPAGQLYWPVRDRYGRVINYPLSSPELLIGLLEAFGRELPDYLFHALIENLQAQVPAYSIHQERWALMLNALDEKGICWDEAPEWVSRELRKRRRPPASPGTVLRSYNKVEAEQRRLGRGRPRTYRKR